MASIDRLFLGDPRAGQKALPPTRMWVFGENPKPMRMFASPSLSRKFVEGSSISRAIESFTRSTSFKAYAGARPLTGGNIPYLRFIVPALMWAGATTAFGIGRQLQKTIKFRQTDRPGALRQGPGYISWGKTSGMPDNHLSTNGLSLALSNMRHTSVL